MYLCAWLDRWPSRARPKLPDGVKFVALPWAGVAEHVSVADVSGEGLTAALASCDVKLVCVMLSPLTCLDRASFDRQTDDAYMQMQIAERLGAEAVVLTSGHAGSVGYDTMRSSATRLAALAERMDLRLLVANAHGSALEQPDALTVLLRDARSAALGVYLDNRAFHRAAVNPADAVVRFAARLGAVRLRDERNGLACVPGEGVGHVAATLEALAGEHFSGPVLVEAGWIEAMRNRFGALLTGA